MEIYNHCGCGAEIERLEQKVRSLTYTLSLARQWLLLLPPGTKSTEFTNHAWQKFIDDDAWNRHIKALKQIDANASPPLGVHG